MRALLLMLTLLGAASSSAQEPPEDPGPPPPYRFKVLDLIFRVDDIGGRVEDIGGRVADIGGRVADMVVRETETETRVDLAADVLFDFDKADLLPKAEETLQKAAAFVKEKNRGGVVSIEGHTDAKGSDSYNRKLSLRRAESVRKWFLSHGLDTLKFSADGLGAAKPVAPNTKPDGSDDPDGRQKNRRVEIVIRKK